MLGFLAKLVGGALDPLLDQIAGASSRLARKLGLLAVAAVCLVVVLIALTIAFDLWIASMAGAIVGALSVAAVYFLVAMVALYLALRKSPTSRARQAAEDNPKQTAEAARSRAAHVDAFTAPLLAALAGLGLRREQLAVLAGTSLAKRLGPLPLVGLAVVGGFLLGRLGKSWRALLSADGLEGLLASAATIFSAGAPEDEKDESAA